MTAVQSNIVSDRAGPARARLTPVVLQVLPSLETGGGGVERTAIDIAAAIRANGAPAYVASSGGQLVSELDRRGATHITLPLVSKNPLVMRRNVQRLVDIIEEHGINIVHARSRAPAWSARAAARRTGCSFITTFHGAYNYGTGLAGAWKKRYNAVMADGDLVIANSHFIADHLRTHYGVPEDRIRIVPRGIDLNVFDPARTKVARVVDLARRWSLPDGASVVMLPGRLTRWKGQTLFIEALALLKDRLGADNFKIVGLLVGSDQGREAYRAELEQQKVARAGRPGATVGPLPRHGCRLHVDRCCGFRLDRSGSIRARRCRSPSDGPAGGCRRPWWRRRAGHCGRNRVAVPPWRCRRARRRVIERFGDRYECAGAFGGHGDRTCSPALFENRNVFRHARHLRRTAPTAACLIK